MEHRYRGVDREGGGYPGTFRDVAAAADRLREEARAHALDLTRMIAVGHSAGGHLALWLAARHRLPADSPLATADPLPIAQVISLGGLPDLAAVAASRITAAARTSSRNWSAAARTRSRYVDPPLLPIGVRQILVNGREDVIVPYRLATDYVAQAQAAGDSVDLHTIPTPGMSRSSPRHRLGRHRALILAALAKETA